MFLTTMCNIIFFCCLNPVLKPCLKVVSFSSSAADGVHTKATSLIRLSQTLGVYAPDLFAQGQVSNIKGQPLCPRTCKIIQTSQSTGGPHNLAKLVLRALHKLPPITPLPPPTPLLHSLELPISGCNPLPGPERSLLSFGAVSNQELYLSTTSSIPVSLCCVLLKK